MKNKIPLILSLISTILTQTNALECTNEAIPTDVKVYIDNVEVNTKDANGIDQKPIIYDGQIYLPAKFFSQAVNKDYNYVGIDKKIYIGKYNAQLTKLEDLNPFSILYDGSFKLSKISSYTAVDGTKYANGFEPTYSSYGTGPRATFTHKYKINAKYAKLSFSLIPSKDWITLSALIERPKKNCGNIKIKLDDNVIYSNNAINAEEAKPNPVELNISGGLVLEIEGALESCALVNPILFN